MLQPLKENFTYEYDFYKAKELVKRRVVESMPYIYYWYYSGQMLIT